MEGSSAGGNYDTYKRSFETFLEEVIRTEVNFFHCVNISLSGYILYNEFPPLKFPN